jgi:hypothetical protein
MGITTGPGVTSTVGTTSTEPEPVELEKTEPEKHAEESRDKVKTITRVREKDSFLTKIINLLKNRKTIDKLLPPDCIGVVP